MNTRLERWELWADKLPNSFLNRANETVKYLKTQDLSGTIADCGEDNPLKHIIADAFSLEIDTIDYDFDRIGPKPEKKYRIIFCFELLEHLMNPLLFLEQIRTSFLEPGGVIYLSTPYQRPQFLKAIHHFHEIPKDRLMWLFQAAGLRIEEEQKITIAGNWYNHLSGVRPIMRYFQKTRLYKLKVI